MTTSPPEIKTGLRLGLAALAATGCLVAVLAAGLPVRAAESDPVLAKVNGSEIHASDVALAEEELGPSLQHSTRPVEDRLRLLADTLALAWQPADAHPGPTVDKAGSLHDLVTRLWVDLGRPCPPARPPTCRWAAIRSAARASTGPTL